MNRIDGVLLSFLCLIDWRNVVKKVMNNKYILQNYFNLNLISKYKEIIFYYFMHLIYHVLINKLTNFFILITRT